MTDKQVTDEKLDSTLSLRISEPDLTTLRIKAHGQGKPYQMMVREMVKAYNEDRLRIIPTDNQKKGLEIYKEN